MLVPERLHDIIWKHPKSGIHESDISTGPAKSDFLGFKKRHIGPGLGQMKGCGKPGIAASDYCHVRVRFSLKCVKTRRVRCG